MAAWRAVPFEEGAVATNDLAELLLGHSLPIPGDVDEMGLGRRGRHVPEPEAGDDPVIAAAAALAGPEQIGGRTVLFGDRDLGPLVRIDGDDLDRGQPVDDQPVFARQQAVAAAADMAAGADRIAGAGRKRPVVELVEGPDDVPQSRPRLHAIGASGLVIIGARHRRHVDDHPVQIADREILVAMAAAAHRHPPAGVDRTLDDSADLLGAARQGDRVGIPHQRRLNPAAKSRNADRRAPRCRPDISPIAPLPLGRAYHGRRRSAYRHSAKAGP